jgi:hypothetical protein
MIGLNASANLMGLVGSMSHLAKNGLNFYAPILVETMTRMAGKVLPGVNVIPFVPVLIDGIGSETLAQDMMDLDSWCAAQVCTLLSSTVNP